MEELLITPLGYKALTEKKKELTHDLSKKGNDLAASKKRNDLFEVENILANAKVIDFDEKTPASVQIGTKVTLENLRNGDKREYTIMSRSTANPLKGIISNESPLAQKMMGFKLGNTFKIKEISGSEESYKISNIE